MMGGNKAPKPDPDINQCAKLLSTDTLNLNLPGSDFVCGIYDIPIILYKDSKGGQYSVIPRKEGNIPDESHLSLFEEEYCSE